MQHKITFVRRWRIYCPVTGASMPVTTIQVCPGCKKIF